MWAKYRDTKKSKDHKVADQISSAPRFDGPIDAYFTIGSSGLQRVSQSVSQSVVRQSVSRQSVSQSSVSLSSVNRTGDLFIQMQRNSIVLKGEFTIFFTRQCGCLPRTGKCNQIQVLKISLKFIFFRRAFFWACIMLALRYSHFFCPSSRLVTIYTSSYRVFRKNCVFFKITATPPSPTSL